jgi:hypothetical protein
VSSRARWTEVFLEVGGTNAGELVMEKERGWGLLVFFPVFPAPAGLFSIDNPPLRLLDLLVTCRLVFSAFRPRFRFRHCRCPFRWRLTLLTAAAGFALLRSGAGHVG